MLHTVLLANQTGDELRPLTNPGLPPPFLALGDRRTLLERSADRLAPLMSDGELHAIVGVPFAARAAEILGAETHVVESAPGPHQLVETLCELVDGLPLPDGGTANVLLLSAAAIVGKEEGFRAALTAAIGESQGALGFTARDNGEEHGIDLQFWPCSVLSARLQSLRNPSGEAPQGLLATLGSQLPVRSLGEIGWIDVRSWHAVRRILSHVEKPWGHETLWALNRNYAGKILFIKAGESLSLQYHEVKDETIRIASGRMRFRVGQSVEALEAYDLEPGMSYAIPPGLVHQMEALDDCRVIEVSTPQLTDVVRLEDRYGRS